MSVHFSYVGKSIGMPLKLSFFIIGREKSEVQLKKFNVLKEDTSQ